MSMHSYILPKPPEMDSWYFFVILKRKFKTKIVCLKLTCCLFLPLFASFDKDLNYAQVFCFFCFPSFISGLHHFWWDFCICDFFLFFFQSHHRGSHILSSWMVHAECIFAASIHSSRTWTSGSFESVRWKVWVHRLDLGLHSHLEKI